MFTRCASVTPAVMDLAENTVVKVDVYNVAARERSVGLANLDLVQEPVLDPIKNIQDTWTCEQHIDQPVHRWTLGNTCGETNVKQLKLCLVARESGQSLLKVGKLICSYATASQHCMSQLMHYLVKLPIPFMRLTTACMCMPKATTTCQEHLTPIFVCSRFQDRRLLLLTVPGRASFHLHPLHCSRPPGSHQAAPLAF